MTEKLKTTKVHNDFNEELKPRLNWNPHSHEKFENCLNSRESKNIFEEIERNPSNLLPNKLVEIFTEQIKSCTNILRYKSKKANCTIIRTMLLGLIKNAS